MGATQINLLRHPGTSENLIPLDISRVTENKGAIFIFKLEIYLETGAPKEHELEGFPVRWFDD